MKRMLLATTVLALTAPMAVAEISFSGYGRFGLNYNSDAVFNESQIDMRMRINIDGSVETDSGITFGGRIRLQYDENTVSDNDSDGLVSNDRAGAQLSPAMLYATGFGVRVEVGNANTAYDSVALMYNSEIGYLDRGFGDPNGNYFSFNSTPYGSEEINRMGLFVSYSAGGFNGRISLVDPDQTGAVVDEEELSLSVDYAFGQATVAAAYVDNAAGVENAQALFLGAEYAVSDAANIGLLYFDYDEDLDANDSVRVTLYGNYTMDAITFKGYVATDDQDGLANDTAYGLGVDYDLGGARLSGDIHRSYAEETIAGLGVRFDF
jgi:outer membrane protein OmpU